MPLTPFGAGLLRAARDEIVAHPEQFDMGTWECGTEACIAGHIHRQLMGTVRQGALTRIEVWTKRDDWGTSGSGRVYRALGATGDCADIEFREELRRLFYRSYLTSAAEAAEAINALLWAHGYPPDEIPEPVRQGEAPLSVVDVVGEAHETV